MQPGYTCMRLRRIAFLLNYKLGEVKNQGKIHQTHHSWSDPKTRHKTGIDRVPHKSINSSLDKVWFWSWPASCNYILYRD